MIPANEALERLVEGNRRFVSGSQGRGALAHSATHRRGARSEANPIAVILGCADSRVPVETIFDQGVGDLFVVRVAGNIAGPTQIGSIEFAVEQFALSLVVVLGHSMCGAVTAAMEDVRTPAKNRPSNLQKLVDVIRPSIEAVLKTGDPEDPDKLLEQSVRANIRASMDRLSQESQFLEPLVRRGELLIVGAEYSLDTGVVDFR